MSYCRVGSDSDVYAYKGDEWVIYCDGDRFQVATLQDFKARMETLREQGYKVPQYALDRINSEIEAT